jgi:hypothetical protein
MAQINGTRVLVYVYQNGAKLDDAAGQGHDVAEDRLTSHGATLG